MSEQKENFLDSQSLLALLFLAIAWLGWNHYMKKKYPPAETQKKEELVQEEKKHQPLKSSSSSSDIKKGKEELLLFQGENMDIVFSSWGLGIKELKFKKYYDRKGSPLVFKPSGPPLFSSHFFKESGPAIPFKVHRKGGELIGVFSFSHGKIIKKVEIQDSRFILINKLEVEIKNQQEFPGLSLFFSHPLPKDSPQGFLKMFFLYGQDLLKGYVSYEGGEKERLLEKDLEEEKNYQNLNVAALGGRYFGKAFINKAPLFPSASFKLREDQAESLINYEFLHNKKQQLEYQIFLGPKSLKNFQLLDKQLRNWLDFGFFGWLARPLLLFLNNLYNWCKNWGLAIVFLTLFIRLLLLPINIKSYKSMKVMQKIQPEIKKIKETYKSDPKKMNLEVMALMKQHKANPLGGCLPLFIQFPVFFALYRVLGESIELYQSPFVFWIKDLSLKDPFYVLPVLGGLVLFVQQKMTPMNLPKEQARLLTAMPLVFSVFMLALPSGLTLYIFVSGLFGLIQQYFFVRLNYLRGGENDKTI